MRRRVFLEVRRDQERQPGRIRVGVGVAVDAGVRDRSHRSPVIKGVLGIENADEGIGDRDIHEREQARARQRI